MIPYLKKIQKRLFNRKPISAIFIPSRVCNLKCRQCSIWKYQTKDSLTFNQKILVITKLHKWLGDYFQLNISGGEPFASPDTIRLINYACKKKIFVSVNTNGTLLNESTINKLCKHKKYLTINFSLDGPNAKIHDNLRGKVGTFDKLIVNINYWKKMKNKFSIISVISEGNVKYLNELCDLAIQLGAYSINFQPLDLYSFSNRMNSLKEFKTHSLWPKNFSLLKSSLLKLIKYKDMDKVNILKNSTEEIWSYINYFKNPFNRNQKCNNETRSVIICRNGDITLCTNPKFKLGNIITDNVDELWRSKKRIEIDLKKRECTLPCKILGCHRKKNWTYFINQKFLDIEKKFLNLRNARQ